MPVDPADTAHSPTWNRWIQCLRLTPLILVAVSLVSCASQRREAWKEDYLAKEEFGKLILDIETVTNGDGLDIVINRETLDMQAQGEAVRGQVTVAHPGGAYTRGARTAASWLDGALRDTEKQLGINVPTRLRLVVFPVEKQPRSVRARYEISAEEFLAPVVMPTGKFRAEDILGGSFGSMVTVWHEIYEMLLIIPWVKPTALPDGSGGLGIRSKNYTRWFRDGFATYAAYLTLENLRKRSGRRWPPELPFGSLFYEQPFSSLAEAGTALFRWDQFDSERKNPVNYSASFGLFLLLEERYGVDGIRRMLRAVSALEYPDGEAILAASQSALGVDLRALVEAYSFPESVLVVASELRDFEGAAEVTVDGVVTPSVFDFERAIERARSRKPSVDVVIDDGDRAVSIQLPVAASR